jgi:hypothetical protein
MATAVAEQTEKREKTEPTPPATPDPDLYPYILKLVERLEPAERLQLVADIVRTVQPLVGEPVDDDEDDEDDEDLAREAMDVLENTPDDDWLDWKEVKAELMRAESAGELPD